MAQLWITFKSCIFAFWNNITICSNFSEYVVNYIQILYLCILKQRFYDFPLQKGVVNYIQILYLCILKQPLLANGAIDICCELHSNLVSLHSETTLKRWSALVIELWITFKSCIFAFWNNQPNIQRIGIEVVNYIQILYLCILKQLFVVS